MRLGAVATPPRLAARYRDRIRHIHAKDVRPDIMAKARAGDWSFLDAILGQGSELGVETVPGDGMVDYAAVFRALPGYSGWVVVEAEQDPEKANPLGLCQEGRSLICATHFMRLASNDPARRIAPDVPANDA
jgi:sugar phosphate isomerase/epimerase